MLVGIAATASFLIQDMNYDQFRPATPFDTLLVPYMCFSSHLTPFLTSGKQWPLGQIGTSKSKTVVGIAVTTSL
jgi:hypothetical protein